VTLRGEPLADIIPAGRPRADARLTALVADGRIAPRSRPLPDKPPRLASAGESASAHVLAERDLER
jgi:antitoxin (DNA-binding transcriptional repressor) of toxin-antitoxin stability system